MCCCCQHTAITKLYSTHVLTFLNRFVKHPINGGFYINPQKIRVPCSVQSKSNAASMTRFFIVLRFSSAERLLPVWPRTCWLKAWYDWFVSRFSLSLRNNRFYETRKNWLDNSKNSQAYFIILIYSFPRNQTIISKKNETAQIHKLETHTRHWHCVDVCSLMKVTSLQTCLDVFSVIRAWNRSHFDVIICMCAMYN